MHYEWKGLDTLEMCVLVCWVCFVKGEKEIPLQRGVLP